MAGFLVSAGVYVDGGDQAASIRPRAPRNEPSPDVTAGVLPFIPVPGLLAFDEKRRQAASLSRPRPFRAPLFESSKPVFPYPEDVDRMQAWAQQSPPRLPSSPWRRAGQAQAPDRIQVLTPDPADLLWDAPPPAARGHASFRADTSSQQVLDWSYRSLSQAWDLPAPQPRARQAARIASAAAECLTPAVIPDDQQQLGSWRQDVPQVRRPAPFRPSLAGDLPAIAELIDQPLWIGAYQPAPELVRRPVRTRPADQASDPWTALADALLVPFRTGALQPAPELVRRAARTRPADQGNDAGAYLPTFAASLAVPGQAWNVPPVAVRGPGRWSPRATGELALSLDQVQTPVLPPLGGEGLVRWVRPWRPRLETTDNPPWIETGVILVGPPFWVVSVDVYWAGAVAGDVQQGG